MNKLALWAGAVIALGLTPLPARGQGREVAGRVTRAEAGVPVGLATITELGGPGVAQSAADGTFRIKVGPGVVRLVVHAIGYQKKEVTVKADESNVVVTLAEDPFKLEAVVVTGQATSIERRNLANDVATVGAEDLSRVHSETVENALQGKVAGAIITANSGAPGGGLQVRMRGVTSIFGNSAPLYVVDGVPVSNSVIENGLNAVTQSASLTPNSSNQDNGVNRIADLNAADIESVELLKGPSAAAIYGSQAANGVVIITTKRGAPGQTRFSVSQRFGTHEQANTIGERHFSLADAMTYDSTNFGIADTTTQRFFTQSGGFQDFEKQIYGDKSLSYETDVSVSGGGERTQYFFSGLAQHDNGTMYGTGYDKQGLRLNLTTLVGSNLQVRVNTNFVHTLTKRGISNNDNVNITPYFVIPSTPSFFSFSPLNGVFPKNPFLPQGTNLLQTLSLFSLPEDVFRFIGSVEATYSVLTTETQTLKASLNAGIDAYTSKANIYAPASLYWQQAVFGPLAGEASDLTGTETQAPVAFTLTHRYAPLSHSFSATTSAGIRHGYDYLRTNNVVTQNLLAGQQNVNLGTNSQVFENRQDVRQLAIFGQEELLLMDERLYVSAGILGQRSTNNADISKLGGYPKFSASFRWPTLGPFEELKVRAAFGETGNEPLYGDKFTALTGQTYVGRNSVAIQGNLADPNLHPEREREIEGGVDATMFASRIALSVTGYQKNNTDLVLRATLAPSTGYATHVFNGGEIRNRGVEASVSAFPVRTKDVTVLGRVTFTKNVGVVLSLPVPRFIPPNNFGAGYGQGRIEVGASPSQIIGYDTTTGMLHKLGDYEPSFVMGFSSEITYGQFQLFGLLDWRHGSSLVNITQNVYDLSGTAPDSVASAERLKLFFAGKSPYIQDASFVKLREITLSYQLPENLVRSLFGGRVTGAHADLSGRNLVTWTPYKGLDPEVSNFGNQNINRGQDLAPYPPSRSFFFSLGMDF